MYTWLFFKIYYFYKQRNNHDPVFNTSLLVFFSQGLHFFLGLKLLSFAFDFKILKFSSDNSTNKLLFFPIGIIWLVLVHIYYKKKVQNSKRIRDIKPLNLYQLLGLLFFVVVLPLCIVIILSKK
ncbi:hypothetical protein D3C87_41600 [compost metagenome]